MSSPTYLRRGIALHAFHLNRCAVLVLSYLYITQGPGYSRIDARQTKTGEETRRPDTAMWSRLPHSLQIGVRFCIHSTVELRMWPWIFERVRRLRTRSRDSNSPSLLRVSARPVHWRAHLRTRGRLGNSNNIGGRNTTFIIPLN